MADGEIILRLDPDTARLLKKAAEAEGVTPEELGARVIADGMIEVPAWPDDVASGRIDPDPEIDRRIARETQLLADTPAAHIEPLDKAV